MIFDKDLEEFVSDLYTCLQECSRQRKHMEKNWDWSVLGICDSLMKKALQLFVTHCYLHQYTLASNFVFNWERHELHQKLNIIGQFFLRFQEMKAECEILYFYIRVFWFSTEKILKHLCNLWAEVRWCTCFLKERVKKERQLQQHLLWKPCLLL